MKKRTAILLVSVMAAAMAAGCGQSSTGSTTTAATTAAEAVTAETDAEKAAATEAGVKTGMAVVTSFGTSKDAGEKDGSAEVDSVVAAVVLDEEGKIVDCVLDMAQTKMGFTAEGTVVMSEGFKTKKELKEDYGMKAASSIGKEWYEQAETLEQYVIGKTAEEVEGIALDDSSKAADVDLLAGVTVAIGSYKEAIVEAAKNAAVIGTQAGDKLGLAVVTDMHNSKDASGDKEGQCQAYSTYVAVTVDGDGKITGALIDASQGNVMFDAAGKITSDLTAGVQSKKQLKEGYGMKAASSIGKEWYEQAEAMEDYLVGKTAEEVEGISVDDSGKATDADLLAGVTVAVGDFKSCAVKAAENAQE